MHRLLALHQEHLCGLWSPPPYRSTTACEKHMEALRCSVLACECVRTWGWEGPKGTQACLPQWLENHFRKLSTAQTYVLLSFLFFSSLLTCCVSVICTVSSKDIKEINSNSLFPLLIKVIARKNSRQYQFIYHKLSISYWASTDLTPTGMLVCKWYYSRLS